MLKYLFFPSQHSLPYPSKEFISKLKGVVRFISNFVWQSVTWNGKKEPRKPFFWRGQLLVFFLQPYKFTLHSLYATQFPCNKHFPHLTVVESSCWVNRTYESEKWKKCETFRWGKWMCEVGKTFKSWFILVPTTIYLLLLGIYRVFCSLLFFFMNWTIFLKNGKNGNSIRKLFSMLKVLNTSFLPSHQGSCSMLTCSPHPDTKRCRVVSLTPLESVHKLTHSMMNGINKRN